MKRCKICGIPDTHPQMKWLGHMCQACVNYVNREKVDWDDRKQLLKDICDKYRKNDGSHDCLIAVSGGKDSHFITNIMVNEMNMHPLLITVMDSFTHTDAGKHNLQNLSEVFKTDHWTYTINRDLFIRTTRWAFEQIGRPLDFIEYAIYLIPSYFAKIALIPLVIFGENSAYEYGATAHDTYDVNPTLKVMNSKLRRDAEWWQKGGITKEEVMSICPHVYKEPIALYMSYFTPWSSTEHLKIAKQLGFKELDWEWKREGTIEQFEQIDSYGYCLHLWLRYCRMGFQRTTDIATRRVREGVLTRKKALELIKEHDHKYDVFALEDFCATLGYTKQEFWDIVRNAEWNKYYESTQN